jgi:hypothetical protein
MVGALSGRCLMPVWSSLAEALLSYCATYNDQVNNVVSVTFDSSVYLLLSYIQPIRAVNGTGTWWSGEKSPGPGGWQVGQRMGATSSTDTYTAAHQNQVPFHSSNI